MRVLRVFRHVLPNVMKLGFLHEFCWRATIFFLALFLVKRIEGFKIAGFPFNWVKSIKVDEMS